MTDQNIDMDTILDEALDELDDDDSEHDCADSKPAAAPRPLASRDTDSVLDGPGEKENGDDENSPAAVFQKMLRNFIEADDDGTDPDERLGEFMNQVNAQLPPEEGEKNHNPVENSPNEGIEKTIAAILEEMSKAKIGDGPDITPGDFDFGTDSLNPDAVIDGMMEQLLSKDLMYEPMKQVAEKFPGWLEDKKDSLPAAEYEQ